jgi:hypothetical protein
MTAAIAMLNNINMNVSEQNPDISDPTISFITRTVPDLPLPEMDKVTNENTVVTVPIDATKDMNLAGSFSGIIADAMDAPAVEVIPGYHPAIHPTKTPFIPGTELTG